MSGDFDPEDEYDAGDPLHIRLRVLNAAVTDVLEHTGDRRRAARRTDLLRLAEQMSVELYAAELAIIGALIRLAD